MTEELGMRKGDPKKMFATRFWAPGAKMMRFHDVSFGVECLHGLQLGHPKFGASEPCIAARGVCVTQQQHIIHLDTYPRMRYCKLQELVSFKPKS